MCCFGPVEHWYTFTESTDAFVEGKRMCDQIKNHGRESAGS